MAYLLKIRQKKIRYQKSKLHDYDNGIEGIVQLASKHNRTHALSGYLFPFQKQG